MMRFVCARFRGFGVLAAGRQAVSPPRALPWTPPPFQALRCACFSCVVVKSLRLGRSRPLFLRGRVFCARAPTLGFTTVYVRFDFFCLGRMRPICFMMAPIDYMCVCAVEVCVCQQAQT